MIRKRLTYAACLLLAASGLALGSSTAKPVVAQSWPNQCWNDDGGPTCPICGGGCMGGDYLCCNNGG